MVPTTPCPDTLGLAYGRFIRDLRWETLPGPVREKVLDLVADWIANAVAGYGSDIATALAAQSPESSGGCGGVVTGGRTVCPPLQAALVNGAACHALEFDDTYRKGLYHPGAPVISAAWSAAGTTALPGARFLAGVVAGYEVSMRLADAVNPAHNRKWHTTGTVGTFGAAAGAASCLGLDAPSAAGALGLAGTQASGLWEILPDAPGAKGIHAGKAAQSGLLSALLSRQGIWGPASIFEGDRGFFSAMVDRDIAPDTCLSGLGHEWRLLQTTIKAYPVCGHTMTAVEAALALSRDLEPDRISRIEIRAHPVSAGIAGNPSPKTGLEAKFSIAFCVALALAKKQVTMSEFSPDLMTDPAILSLLSRTTLVRDQGLGRVKGQRPAKVTVWLADGSLRSETAHTRKGDPENPMARPEIRQKFTDLTAPAWRPGQAGAVFDAVYELPECRDFTAWTRDVLLAGQ